jgi:RES domain
MTIPASLDGRMKMTFDDEIAAKRLCADCVGENYLKAEMESRGKRRKCSYCGATGRTFNIEEMAGHVERAFEQHFLRTPDQPNAWQDMLLRDKESHYHWDREGVPVIYAIMDAVYISEGAATDIQRLLEERHCSGSYSDDGYETEFSSESYYEEKAADSTSWQHEWNQFESSIRTEARFFSRAAVRLLKSVFVGIADLKTRDGRPLILTAGPRRRWNKLYRARVFQSDERLHEALTEPDRLLGSPPSRLANAGRMNARGISVFYGSRTSEIALAEVRPPVGAKVAIACFEIIRPTTLLDLTAFDDVILKGSIFDPDYANSLDRLAFLRSLSKRIARPVMPDDEAFDYLATQAVADYLATEAETPVDGIILPSVQAAGGGLNVVLFHKAAGIERIVLPSGTKTDVIDGRDSDEGWETEYTVYEVAPAAADQSEIYHEDAGWPDPLGEWVDGSYKPTLRVDPDSIYVHVIEAVKFTTVRHKVGRHRRTQSGARDPSF